MGAFRLIIDGVGGHGDDRKAKEGEPITLGPHPSPDVLAKQCAELMRPVCGGDFKATLIHWPDTPSEVVDDLVNMKRIKGSF